jgi:hypothetical protein
MFKNFFNKIKEFVKKDLGIEEIKKIKNNTKTNDIEIFDKILKMNEKILESTKNQTKILDDDIKCTIEELKKTLNNLEKRKKFKIYKCDANYCFLLADDNPSSLLLMENDLKYILGLPSFVEEEIKSEKIIQERKNIISKISYLKKDNFNFKIIKASGDLAPFNLIFSLLNGLKIDYAILDIIFGGIIENNGKPLFLDGIDVAEYILNNNPRSIIVFYTGCDLNEITEEYNKFKDIENKYSNRVFLVDKDINDENRVKVFLNSFNQFLNLNFKKLNNSESVNDVKC